MRPTGYITTRHRARGSPRRAIGGRGSARLLLSNTRSHYSGRAWQKTGRHKVLCDHDTSLHLSDKGSALKSKRRKCAPYLRKNTARFHVWQPPRLGMVNEVGTNILYLTCILVGGWLMRRRRATSPSRQLIRRTFV